jgi:hypothetical protein
MGDVIQLRRPTWIVLGVGILGCCLFLWTARLEHLAFEAISLVSNPSFSKASIKGCCAASNGGTIIVDDTLTLAGWKKVEGGRNGRSTNF